MKCESFAKTGANIAEDGTTDADRTTARCAGENWRRGMIEQKRCCENCGNTRCANSLVAYWWDECVDSNFEKHWRPKEETKWS